MTNTFNDKVEKIKDYFIGMEIPNRYLDMRIHDVYLDKGTNIKFIVLCKKSGVSFVSDSNSALVQNNLRKKLKNYFNVTVNIDVLMTSNYVRKLYEHKTYRIENGKFSITNITLLPYDHRMKFYVKPLSKFVKQSDVIYKINSIVLYIRKTFKIEDDIFLYYIGQGNRKEKIQEYRHEKT